MSDDSSHISGDLILKEYDYCWDRGSILLIGEDELKQKINIELIQRMFLDQITNRKRIPGRLYVNQKLIDIRSERENQVLLKLKNAKIEPNRTTPTTTILRNLEWKDKLKYCVNHEFRQMFSNESRIRSYREQIIEFVDSEEYLELPGILS